MWNLKCGTNEPIYRTETDSQYREQICGCQGGGEGSIVDGEFGVSRYKHLEWISIRSTIQHRELQTISCDIT